MRRREIRKVGDAHANLIGIVCAGAYDNIDRSAGVCIEPGRGVALLCPRLRIAKRREEPRPPAPFAAGNRFIRTQFLFSALSRFDPRHRRLRIA